MFNCFTWDASLGTLSTDFGVAGRANSEPIEHVDSFVRKQYATGFFLCLIIEKCMLVGGYRKDLAWGSNCHYL